MSVECQLADGATQFDGTVDKGLWNFDADFRDLPRTTRVVLTALSYHTDTGGNPGDISFFAVRPGGSSLERILLGRATQAQITGPGDEGNVTFCGKVLPREPVVGSLANQFWNVVAISEGKDVDASACVDYVLEPFPDTSPQDSP